MKSIRVNKNWIKDFKNVKTLIEELQVFYDFLKDGEISEEEVKLQYELSSQAIEKLDPVNRDNFRKNTNEILD